MLPPVNAMGPGLVGAGVGGETEGGYVLEAKALPAMHEAMTTAVPRMMPIRLTVPTSLALPAGQSLRGGG
jgi:hypothetical protein